MWEEFCFILRNKDPIGIHNLLKFLNVLEMLTTIYTNFIKQKPAFPNV